MTPSMSIVTPSYNQGAFVRYTIDSVLQSGYVHVEHLVMDGGSTDDTCAVLQSYDDPRLKWVSEPDSGQSDAINKGMRQATGDILAYLNSDDLVLPGALPFVADYFDRHPDVSVIYGQCLTIDAAGSDLNHLRGNPFDLKRLLTGRTMISQPAAFWRREVMERIGLFDETLHYTMDFDYWTRMVIAGYTPVYIPRPLAAFRLHGESKTTQHVIPFVQDRLRTLDKTYSATGLPPEFLRLKGSAYAYALAGGVDRLWRAAQYSQARPLLRDILRGDGPRRLKVLSLARYVDSYLHTNIGGLITHLYRRVTNGD